VAEVLQGLGILIASYGIPVPQWVFANKSFKDCINLSIEDQREYAAVSVTATVAWLNFEGALPPPLPFPPPPRQDERAKAKERKKTAQDSEFCHRFLRALQR